MTLPDFTFSQWMVAVLAALFCGIAKAGLSGIGMLTVLLMAEIIPGKASSGAVLPLLIFADVMAAALFRQRILWPHIRALAWPVFGGLVAGWLVMMWLPDAAFRPVVGGLVLVMVGVHLARSRWPGLAEALPHAPWFLWSSGFFTGLATMIANAAGPVASIYLLIVGLAKREFVSTMAWLFLFVNLVKVPFSLHLGLISVHSLSMNLALLPCVAAGLFLGRAVVNRMPQGPFQAAVVVLAALSAARLIAFSLIRVFFYRVGVRYNCRQSPPFQS